MHRHRYSDTPPTLPGALFALFALSMGILLDLSARCTLNLATDPCKRLRASTQQRHGPRANRLCYWNPLLMAVRSLHWS